MYSYIPETPIRHFINTMMGRGTINELRRVCKSKNIPYDRSMTRIDLKKLLRDYEYAFAQNSQIQRIPTDEHIITIESMASPSQLVENVMGSNHDLDPSMIPSCSMNGTESKNHKIIQISIPDPSEEQHHALELFSSGHNVLIDSVAGGGKTTFIIHLARMNHSKSFLFLTYNRRLKEETQSRCDSIGLTNLKIYTYHGFGLRYLGNPCRDDSQLWQLLANQFIFPINFDAIVIDESQDIIPLFFRVIHKILGVYQTNHKPMPQICIIGDQHQMIYDFRGADSRFLTLAEQIYKQPFHSCQFQTTYRCTKQIVNFVNALLGFPRMISQKDGESVKYIVSSFHNPTKLVMLIRRLISKYGVNQMFILLPSVRTKMFSAFVNRLSKIGIDIDVPNSDESQPSATIQQNKLPIITYHQSKGLERDCVLVLEFDDGYFTCYAKSSPHNVLSNPQYVALTRARKELFVIQNNISIPLLFVDRARSFCEHLIIDNPNILYNGLHDNVETNSYYVTELIRFMKPETIINIMQLLKIKQNHMAEDSIDIPQTTSGRHGCIEDVSDINGVAFPILYHCLVKHGNLSNIFEKMIENDPEVQTKSSEYEILWNSSNICDIVKAAAFFHAIQSKYEQKLIQITNWNWINHTHITMATDRMKSTIGCEGQQEIHVKRDFCGTQLTGFIDWVVFGDTNTYYELKCTSELKDEHKIQLALYAFIVYDETKKQIFRLFNIKTGELVELVLTRTIVEQIYNLVLHDKEKAPPLSQEEFIQTFSSIKPTQILEHVHPRVMCHSVDDLLVVR